MRQNTQLNTQEGNQYKRMDKENDGIENLS